VGYEDLFEREWEVFVAAGIKKCTEKCA